MMYLEAKVRGVLYEIHSTLERENFEFWCDTIFHIWWSEWIKTTNKQERKKNAEKDNNYDKGTFILKIIDKWHLSVLNILFLSCYMLL